MATRRKQTSIFFLISSSNSLNSILLNPSKKIKFLKSESIASTNETEQKTSETNIFPTVF